MLKKINKDIADIRDLKMAVHNSWFNYYIDDKVSINDKWNIWTKLIECDILDRIIYSSGLKLEVPIIGNTVPFEFKYAQFQVGDIVSSVEVYEDIIYMLKCKKLEYKEDYIKLWMLDKFWNTKAIIHDK